MKRFLLPVILAVALFLVDNVAQAQRGRIYRGYPVYRSRPMVSVGIGGVLGGYYGPGGWRGYGWGPRVGVNVGVLIPPPGSSVRGLPPGAVKREINGITYYYRNDLYFRELQEGGFEVVEAPIGATLYRIPPGAELRKIEGKYYYERNGTFYARETDRDGRVCYTIVGKNGTLGNDTPYDDDTYNEPIERDNVYDDNRQEAPVVKNGNEARESGEGAYSVRPQVGDRFEQLPRDSREVNRDGKKLFVSPNGVYYKEVKEEGAIEYEVVDVK
ncbi:DUF6515 family protein [Niabella yanshanensis]|uniref:DUF6515 family protein n=1 Tax=Niabella yanshanensis TaxID=577386 RepID=A0ABZ0W2X8_9BACT|nr:DUF6515 family protein [Niabella yanshanensis]WQD37597.1 DUF6515 family protein [Niabella yanshanensis]